MSESGPNDPAKYALIEKQVELLYRESDAVVFAIFHKIAALGTLALSPELVEVENPEPE